MLHQNNGAWWNFVPGVSAVTFLEIPSFSESSSFHREMFGSTNFQLVLMVCTVNAMIITKLKCEKFVQDKFS